MWIEFSEFNLKLLIPLIFPIFKRIQDYTKKSYLKNEYQIFKIFRNFSSYIFSVIPFLIIKYRTKNSKIKEKDTQTKSKTEESEEDNESTSYAYTLSNITTLSNEITELKKKNDRKRTIYSIIFLLILCALGMLSYFYRYWFELEQFAVAKQSIGIFFEIFDYVFLSYLILKQKLYKHNFASSGIIALILIILFIISLPYKQDNKFFLSLVYFLFYSMCFGSYDVLGKKYMTKYFVTPYFFMFTVGVINVTFLLFYELFTYFLNPDISGIISGFRENIKSIGEAFLFILDLILQDIWNLGIWLTVYYLTPCHYFISEYISEYVYYMIEARDKNYKNFYSTSNVVIFSICYFINFLCCLIFNEVVILNFCGLDYNTKKRINQRISKESNEIRNLHTLIEMDDSENDDENDANN